MSTPRGNVTLNGSDNEAMQPSYIRLLECAREATAASPKPITTTKAMYQALGESSATNTNWKKRGVSLEGAMKAQAAWGCSAAYVRDAKLPKWVMAPPDENSTPATDPKPSLDHPFMGAAAFVPVGEDDKNAMTAPVVAWAVLEAVLMKPNREWPAEAFVAFTSITQPISDRVKAVTVTESEIPTISPGDRIAIDPLATPWHDCVILVRLPGGALSLRRYRALADDGWEALVPGEAPMDSKRHGLTLVGVVVALNKARF